MDNRELQYKLMAEVFSRWEIIFDELENDRRTAIENMRHRRTNGNGCLIAVAAQHPLKDGLIPGPEFTVRLNRAYELYQEKTAAGIPTQIYVPGSRHRVNNIADLVSLSEAGVTYLQHLGVPESALRGEDVIRKYKGDEGVYNAQDEAFTTGKLFVEEDFAELYLVCSVNQVPRSALTYIELGLYPTFKTISMEDPGDEHHSIVYELRTGVPKLLLDRRDLYQGDSVFGIESRNNRRA